MSLGRIPFTASDERNILSLGSWMTFIAVVNFIACAFLLLGGVCLAFQGASLARAGGAFAALGPMIGVIMMGVMVVIAGILIYQGRLLLDAKTSFNQVVTSDDDDQMHVSHGLGTLRTFFLIEVILGVVSLLNAGFQLLGML